MPIIANVAVGSTDNTTATTAPVNTSGASLLVLALASYQGVALPTISDSKGNVWISLTTYELAGDTRSKFYYVRNPIVGSGHTFTAALGSSFPAIAVLAWSDIAQTPPFDVENGGSATAAVSLATGSVTPKDNNVLVVAAVCSQATNGDNVAIDNGFVITNTIAGVGGQCYGVSLAYRKQRTAAAVNPIWSWTSSSNAAVSIATFYTSPARIWFKKA